MIPTPKENFLQSAIQDLLVDVIQVRQVSVLGDASGDRTLGLYGIGRSDKSDTVQ